MKRLSNQANRARIDAGANVVLDREHEIAFMCVPKAANTSIKWAIAEWLGETIDDDEPIHRMQWEYCLPRDIPSGYLSLCIVRNPFDRVASAFRVPGPTIVAQDNWDDYIERVFARDDSQINIHLKSNWWFEQGRADICGDVANLNEAWFQWYIAIQEWTGKQFPEFPVKNVTGFQPDWGPEQIEMIRIRYEKDFEQYERFGWSCGSEAADSQIGRQVRAG